eukprot:CAMPEP_0201566858 /NCGR_PEP_ID=MMETSP0190_2-20130828/6960_1 /ASSEMBLY_ACC=CAM_ASM_000263 /TAXON_ID=37353 /ORGANISM="Rosalina sp." /LENGTH=488 /DNA_ID=CAMNT_0047986129 /DNA_START=39 /DNA_END=1505 /DNA_ORIENTATION=-
MGSDFSLDKYCTAALPIEKNHKVDEDPNGESSELLHEAQQKATSPKTTFRTTKRRSSGSNSNTTSTGSSKSSRKNNKYLDLPLCPSDDDEFDSLEHVEAGAGDSLNVPPNSTKTKSKTRPRSSSSSKAESNGKKSKKKKDKGHKKGGHGHRSRRDRLRNRRNTDPARSPSRSPSRSPTPASINSSRPPVSILIPNNAGTTSPPKLSLLSSVSPKHTSNSSTSSKGSLKISPSGVAYYQHAHKSMTPTGYDYRAGKRHSYHKYHQNKRNRVGRKGRGSAVTDSIHEEIEEYEIQSKQDKHEKDILKAEIMRLRLELAQFKTSPMLHSYGNNRYRGNRPRAGTHSAAVSGPATYTYPTAPKVLRMSTEPVPKFTDHEITEFEGNGTERTMTERSVHSHSKKGSYHNTTDGDNNGFPMTHGTPKTPTKSQTSTPSHSRSVSKSGSTISNSNKGNGEAPQTLLSPLSPLSENMQNIILAFPTTFPEIDGKQQ